MIKTIVSDGGRSQSRRKKETNDCTVRALVNFTRLSFDQCLDITSYHGRQYRKGMLQSDTVRCYQSLGLKFTPFESLQVNGSHGKTLYTVKMFIEKFCQSGKFILRIRGHVFCVKDGIIYDSFTHKEYYQKNLVIGVWTI